MGMTRKDYELIAKAVRFALEVSRHGLASEGITGDAQAEALAPLGTVQDTLCAMLAQENPNFDEERFTKACFRSVQEDEVDELMEMATMRSIELIARHGA